MAAVVVHADIDDAVEKAASAVLAAEGLTFSSAFRLMMNKIAREKAMPFETWEPNKATLQAMEDPGENFDTIDALMADLNADD